MKRMKVDHSVQPLLQIEKKVRECLKCRGRFMSEGNRICPPCTEDNERIALRGSSGKGRGIHRGYEPAKH